MLINGPEHTSTAVLLYLSSLNSLSFFKFYTRTVLQTQQHKFVNWQCDLEYRGNDFTTAVTLGNPDVVVGSGNAFLFW